MWDIFKNPEEKKKRRSIKIGGGRLLRYNKVPRIEKHYISSDYKRRN